MGKRAIYLDERERDLAKRIFDYIICRCELRQPKSLYPIEQCAVQWLHDEVLALKEKFNKPVSEEADNLL